MDMWENTNPYRFVSLTKVVDEWIHQWDYPHTKINCRIIEGWFKYPFYKVDNLGTYYPENWTEDAEVVAPLQIENKNHE